MIMLIGIIIGLIVLFVLKFDIQIKKEWDSYNIVYKTTHRDVYNNQYYHVYKSIRIINFKK